MNPLQTGEWLETAKRAFDIETKSARFDFAHHASGPELRLAFSLNNRSKHEILINKINWEITINGKMIPSAHDTSSSVVLLLPQTSHNDLLVSAMIDRVEARYACQARRGSASNCYVQGVIHGRISGVEFQKEFLSVGIPYFVDEAAGPLTDVYLDPTHIDPLTGLLNRKFLSNNLQKIVDSATPEKPVSFIMIDIDDFKSINDRYGHLTGDDALKAVSAKLREIVGDLGFQIRYGGDEFSVVLRNCDAPKVRFLAEKIRSHTADYEFKVPNEKLRITLSAGIATITHKAPYVTLIQRADDMLRVSKKSGKNKVCEWIAA